jgi:hypothetical protein
LLFFAFAKAQSMPVFVKKIKFMIWDLSLVFWDKEKIVQLKFYLSKEIS